jgi:uncharacterized protein (TIGR03086 family)
VSESEELIVLADATRYMFRSILLVRDADLSASTPCPDWDLRRLLQHLQTSLEHVTDVLSVRGLHDAPRSDPNRDAGTDAVAAIRARIVDLLVAWTSFPTADRWCEVWGQTLPAKVVVDVAAIEMVLHAWDIAHACRTDRPIPAGLASALLKVAPPLAAAGVAGHVFARPLALPIRATASDQLLALFGRQRTFE